MTNKILPDVMNMIMVLPRVDSRGSRSRILGLPFNLLLEDEILVLSMPLQIVFYIVGAHITERIIWTQSQRIELNFGLLIRCETSLHLRFLRKLLRRRAMDRSCEVDWSSHWPLRKCLRRKDPNWRMLNLRNERRLRNLLNLRH